MNPSKATRALTAILFSLIMGVVLAFGGFLAGAYLWSHLGPPEADPDEMGTLRCGILVGGITGLVAGVTLLWKFWPRSVPAEKTES
ncbi:MAG: hypothetical protein ACLP3K_04120 [Candidatus Acidiferrales bacterium]